MIEMIDDFSFDYERDVFENDDGVTLNIDFLDNGNYYIRFAYKDDSSVFEKTFSAKDYKNAVQKIKMFINSQEYNLWKVQRIYPKAPESLNEKEIKELTNKSDAAELKYLKNKTNSLEKRIDVLENSVEDLQK